MSRYEPEGKTLWVRLKPRNPQKGHKLGRHMVFGYLFKEAEGWYRVTEALMEYQSSGDKRRVNFGAYLRECRQSEDSDSALAFDVCNSEAEAKALIAAEEKARKQKVDVEDARNVDVASDFKPANLPSGKPLFEDVSEQSASAQPAKRKPGRPRKNTTTVLPTE